MLLVKLGTHQEKMVFECLCGSMAGFLFQVAPFVWQHIGERNDEERAHGLSSPLDRPGSDPALQS